MSIETIFNRNQNKPLKIFKWKTQCVPNLKFKKYFLQKYFVDRSNTYFLEVKFWTFVWFFSDVLLLFMFLNTRSVKTIYTKYIHWLVVDERWRIITSSVLTINTIVCWCTINGVEFYYQVELYGWDLLNTFMSW